MNLPFTEDQFWSGVKWIFIIGGIVLEVILIYTALYADTDMWTKIIVIVSLVLLDIAIVGVISLVTDKNYLHIHFRRTIQNKEKV